MMHFASFFLSVVAASAFVSVSSASSSITVTGRPRGCLPFSKTSNPQIRSDNTTTIAKKIEEMLSSQKCESTPFATGIKLLRHVKLLYYHGEKHIAANLSKAHHLMSDGAWQEHKPMVLYSYGWLHNATDPYTKAIVKAYGTTGQFNLLVVDWSRAGLDLEYPKVVSLMRRLGQTVAKSLEPMIVRGAKLHHLVGSGVGAHLIGQVARSLRQKPAWVIGLDPAGPLFSKPVQCMKPIAKYDGLNLLVVLTDRGKLGSSKEYDLEFISGNGSRPQPGCGDQDTDTYGPACSHNRATFLWAEAIASKSSIVGRCCSSFEDFNSNKCMSNPTLALGDLSRPQPGKYFFTSNVSVVTEEPSYHEI